MEQRGFKENTSNMTVSEKLNHIWYYYKIYIIGAIAALIMIISFAADISKKKEAVLNITLMGQAVDYNKLTALEDKATADLIKDSKKKQIEFDFLMTSSDQNTQSAAVQKLTAMLASSDIDILVLNKNDFGNYARQEIFQSLDSVPGFSSLDLSGYGTVNYKVDGKDSTEKVYGIVVDKLSALQDDKFDSKDKILCVVSNSKHTDKIREFLSWLLS